VFASKNETDPVFGKALREAAAEGVEVYAHSSEFIGNRITLRGKLKVELAPMLRGNQQIVEHVDLLLVLPLLFEKFYCFPTEFGQVSGKTRSHYVSVYNDRRIHKGCASIL